MGEFRKTQVEEMVAHAAADFLSRTSNRQSLITVTRASISPDLRNATIYFTVFPEDTEAAALEFVKRQRSEFRSSIKKHVRLKSVPVFDFVIDEGEKKRQILDEISNK